MKQENSNLYMFYLSHILYKKYLQNDNILLDFYYDSICEIYNDYLKYDNFKKSLIDSIEDYIEIRKDFVLEQLNDCIDN